MKATKYITVVLCMLIMYGSMLLLLFLPKSEYSENENRYLASFPKASAKNIFAGEYMKDIDSYVTDHFPGRDFFISIKTETEILSGKRKINGIYLCEDGYLIKEYEKPENTDKIGDILRQFNLKITEDYPEINVKLMLVPTAITVYGDKISEGAEQENQLDTISAIENISELTSVDLVPAFMEHRDKSQIFYKTDHHWTSYGAYLGYLEYCKAAGLNAVDIKELFEERVTEDFHGTYSSKVNRYQEKGDEIIIYKNPAQSLKVTYTDTGVVTDTLYNREYLGKKDKYSMFLDNIHPLVELESSNGDANRALVLIKDSYANSMVPFLTNNFARIYVFDTRHYNKGISSFLKEHPEVTDVLILYNMSTIDTDAGVRGIY